MPARVSEPPGVWVTIRADPVTRLTWAGGYLPSHTLLPHSLRVPTVLN